MMNDSKRKVRYEIHIMFQPKVFFKAFYKAEKYDYGH